MAIPINCCCCCLINPNLWDPQDGSLVNTKGSYVYPRSRLWVDAVRRKKLLTNVQEIKNLLAQLRPSHLVYNLLPKLVFKSRDSNCTGLKTIKLDEEVGYALQTKEIDLGVNQAFISKNTFMPDRSRTTTLQQFHSVDNIEVSRRINLLEGNLRAVCEATARVS